jgi:peptide deformylase
MIMPIVIYGSPVLRKKTFDIDAEDDFTEMASSMRETLKQAYGIGLAAPQVGILKSMFVIDTSSFENENCNSVEKAIINPEILNYSEKSTYYNEGCLSIPGIFEDVNRPEEVEVRYRDLNFDWQEEILTGIVARIFQHEYDHLEGILFIDRLSKIRKRLLKIKLSQIIKRNS